MLGTKARKFTTSKKVNVDFFLSEFIATKVIPWKCHIDNSTNDRYGMILGRDLFTALVLDLKFSGNIIIGGEEHIKGVCHPWLT